ncbi:HAMP domain-containing sensor histidine kinase [Phocaeicola sp.]|uniref:sensor histidine kinase n=1 Tax=Phocaeicola sp. TaxID=2773926 RepID=UPI00307C8F00
MDKKKIKEFFADKKNRRFAGLSALTFLGLIGALALQAVWLYNTFMFVQSDMVSQTTNLLEKAITEDTFIRLQKLPLGTKVQSRSEDDRGRNIPEFAYMQESLDELNTPLSIDTLSSIYKNILQEKGLQSNCQITISGNNRILQQTGSPTISIFNIKTHPLPLRKDYSIVIQAELQNSHQLFFHKIGMLLLSTTIFIFFIISCIIYQIRIIARMNKIFQIREDFTYAMIHDMKTPLSSIFTALYFLHSGRLDNKPETKEKYYTIAENEVDHLLTLTNRVLTLSKLESHKLEMNREDVPLEPMVENLTVKFTAKAQKPVRFTADLKAPMVYADKEYLEEVLSNLMDNAIKYSKPEGVDIRIRSELNEKYTVVKVHDNGLGISEADQRTIFNKYERAAAGRKKNKNRPSGFGLGLNFVQQVMHAHEGKVFVTSIEGEFTEFALLFPR